jgi:transposase-like protein
MPKKPTGPHERPAELNVPPELLDQLVKGPMSQGELEELCRSLKKAVIERAMSAEMSQHLGYRPGDAKPAGQNNQRNGTSCHRARKTPRLWAGKIPHPPHV